MREVAIIGAGEVGGLLAEVLARHDIASTIRLIDPDNRRVAEGKALDIMQAAPVLSFAARVDGSNQLALAAGADVVVVADPGAGQWPEVDALVRRVRGFAPHAPVLCAGSDARGLVERAHELGVPRTAIMGSAPEAMSAAARALVALELNTSPTDVALAVLGVPPTNVVIAWEEASVRGLGATRLIGAPARRRLTGRIAALWPPGPYALASAAARVVQAMAGFSRSLVTAFVAPDESAGVRTRAAALPVRVGPAGIVEVVLPDLSAVERVALDNAMLL